MFGETRTLAQDWAYPTGQAVHLDEFGSSLWALLQRAVDSGVALVPVKAVLGLNLTADYVFVLDPWWNPAVEAQAVDRTHRIGQDKTVMVYRMAAADTIEEKVMELKARKQELFTRVIDDDALLSAPLTVDDVKGLFGL